MTVHAAGQAMVTSRPLRAIALMPLLAAEHRIARDERVGRVDDLRAVDGLAGRGDDVDRVDLRGVGADAAVDLLGVAVARADRVVADRDHVGLRAVAVELVDARATVEHVVAEAALEEVVAVAALERVGAVPGDRAGRCRPCPSRRCCSRRR